MLIGKGFTLKDINRLSNDSRRTIVVGDLHGCYDELLDLLSKVDFGSHDRVVAVGDLIVKGPKNKELLELFISDDRFSSVLGNHDVALLSLLAGKGSQVHQSTKTSGT